MPHLTLLPRDGSELHRLIPASVRHPAQKTSIATGLRLVSSDVTFLGGFNNRGILPATARDRPMLGDPQATAPLTRATTFFSTAAVHLTIANVTGHIGPSSSVAASLNPRVA